MLACSYRLLKFSRSIMNGSDPHEYYTGGAHPAGHTVAGMMIVCMVMRISISYTVETRS